jgi:hypothetical protein
MMTRNEKKKKKAKQKRTTATLMDQPQTGCGGKANQSHGRSALPTPRRPTRSDLSSDRGRARGRFPESLPAYPALGRRPVSSPHRSPIADRGRCA